MKKHKAAKDPAPVSGVYQSAEPSELRPFDDAKGGIPVKHNQITDQNHRAKFVPTEETEYNFSKGRK